MHKITGTNLKTTHCSTPQIAALVMQDYQSRGFTNLSQSDEVGLSFFIDFPGMMLATERAVGFGCIEFFPMQFLNVLRTLEKAEDRGGYVKLHGRFACLCIGLAERDGLLSLLRRNADNIEAIADAQLAEWEQKNAG